MPEICRFYGIVIRMYYEIEWASMHRDELRRDWELARKEEKPKKIEPLK